LQNNKSLIIVGATASRKTSTLNAISLFIPSESKIITIEDTRELTLFHKNWIPGLVRETFMGQKSATLVSDHIHYFDHFIISNGRFSQ
jgi:flagellar protein FlaI